MHQPHVRPIVRGKAKTNVEFGNKIDLCLQNGITRFDCEAYNEGSTCPGYYRSKKHLYYRGCKPPSIITYSVKKSSSSSIL